ncbi:MAG: hypothetical protein IH612_03710 [Desulfofustis sp.]|nr:hypothetical protein [Desulfofustis sp.]
MDLFIPHQVNIRIIEAVGKCLGISCEKGYVNVDRFAIPLPHRFRLPWMRRAEGDRSDQVLWLAWQRSVSVC